MNKTRDEEEDEEEEEEEKKSNNKTYLSHAQYSIFSNFTSFRYQ
jgi:hypothetical protein